MNKRTKAYYRYQRNRSIQRKLTIIKNVWGYDEHSDREHPYMLKPGKLSKGKLNCSCKMCKYKKHYDIPKKQTKSTLDLMTMDVREYFEGEC